MKILIVTQYFWPENFKINDLVKELVNRGHNVTVLTGIPNYPTGNLFENYRQNPEEFANYFGAKVWRVPMRVRGNGAVSLFLNYLSFAISACLLGPFRLSGQQADVIFVFEPSPVTVGLPALLLGRIKRAPIVFWVLDLWPETLTAIGAVKSPMLLRWIGYMVKFIYERCTLVLGQSKSFLVSIAKYCSETQKIRYFPNWSEEVLNISDVLPAPELTEGRDLFTVLFTGNVGEAQDLPAVLDSAELVKHITSIRWVIVGDGRKSNWLKEEVDRRDLKSSVLILGRFPLDRMPSFYKHADVLLVSLKKDPIFSMTIPGKVQTYLMTGIPLIGMLDGEGAKIITESNAGLVCAAGDSSGLASAVTKMASMSLDERRKLGINGRAHAQREFSHGLMIDRLEILLSEAVTIFKQKRISRDSSA